MRHALVCAAADAQDGDQVALDRVHNPVRADAQPQHLTPPEGLRRVRVTGQLGDGNPQWRASRLDLS
jgi:hypothetical protein